MVEIAGIIILGIAAQWIAWKAKVPAILPLILIGLFVGPISTLWNDGEKLIQPIYENGRGLFPGKSLFYFVSLSIGVILFEGGLTLKRAEIKDIGPAILKLILLGSFITFIGAGLAAKLIIPELTIEIAFLFAGLIIVTGPTVIAPILQNVPLSRNIATVLKWEGILIDPIGALVAVLVYGFIVSGEGIGFTTHAILEFIKIVIIGTALGAATAYGLFQMIKNDLIPHFLLNVFTLAVVLAAFVLAELLAHESGLLTVVVLGIVLANLDVPRLKEILYFKESLSVLLISMLFIVLAANIDIKDLELLLDWRCLALFGVVIFILRPLGVFLSTRGSELSVREKLFISWVGPRGIVAAGIASLFGLELLDSGVEGAKYITPLVFMIVLGTVLLNATTAKLLARLLGVTQDSSSGILIVGANPVSRLIAHYLEQQKRHVVIVDNSEGNIRKTREEGLNGLEANIFKNDLTDEINLVDMGYLLAMTSSSDVNNYAVKKFKNVFGENGAFRLLNPSEMRLDRAALPQTGILSYEDDFLNLNDIIRDYPTIRELAVKSKTQLHDLIVSMNHDKTRAPLFLRYTDGDIHPIAGNLDTIDFEVDVYFVYLGQELDIEVVEKMEEVEV